MKLTLKQLDGTIRKSWGRDTCHFKFLWDNVGTPESVGHCRVVALIVQDYFGGEIIYSHVKGNRKWDHYWNKLPSGKEVDLAKDQFLKGTKFVKSKVVSREEALRSKRTQRGYRILKKRIEKLERK